jgi:acyl-CoA thioester hydrolase
MTKVMSRCSDRSMMAARNKCGRMGINRGAASRQSEAPEPHSRRTGVVVSDSAEKAGWKHHIEVDVRFADVDMFDHVNNAKYLTYIESARVAYYTEVTGLTDPRTFNMTVARAEIDFLAPAFYGQRLHVLSRAGRIGTKSWTLQHEIRDAESGETLARASTVNVYFHHKSGKSHPLPSEIVEAIERFEGRGLRET